ncbi:MAG: hypothetical protein JSV33_11655 [bacterium]|nr:MAG: hypothetical protein JSV33_11655 [bacterium]
MRKLSEISIVTVLLFVSTVLCVPVEASDTHYSEDFTTTMYKDAVNTTACWDTVAGELKLPPFEVQLVGSVGTPANALFVAVHGDYAFVGLGDYPEFLVMDISNPESPVIVTGIDLPHNGGPVKISGNYAYVACAPGALLQVVDITDPTSPFIAGSCTNMSRCRDIVIAGDFAYIAAGFDGLVVVDISDPTNPTKISSAGCFHYCYVISIAGDYVFLSDEAHGLDVYNISDPYNPVMVGDYQPPGNIVGGTSYQGITCT